MKKVSDLKNDLEFIYHQAPLVRMALDFLVIGEKKHGFDFAYKRFCRTLQRIANRRFGDSLSFDVDVVNSLAFIALKDKVKQNNLFFDQNLTKDLEDLLYGELHRRKVNELGRTTKKADRAIPSRKKEK